MYSCISQKCQNASATAITGAVKPIPRDITAFCRNSRAGCDSWAAFCGVMSTYTGVPLAVSLTPPNVSSSRAASTGGGRNCKNDVEST